MTVISTKLGTKRDQHSSSHPLLSRVLGSLLPSANPDFGDRFPFVRLWWVEIDDAATPRRELGFGDENLVLVAAPLGDNMGFWTDSSMKLMPSYGEQIYPQAFAARWCRFEANWWARCVARPNL